MNGAVCDSPVRAVLPPWMVMFGVSHEDLDCGDFQRLYDLPPVRRGIAVTMVMGDRNDMKVVHQMLRWRKEAKRQWPKYRNAVILEMARNY